MDCAEIANSCLSTKDASNHPQEASGNTLSESEFWS